MILVQVVVHHNLLFFFHPQSMNIQAPVQSSLSLEIGVKLPIFSMECSSHLNGLVPCRKHTLKDICNELTNHLKACLPEGMGSKRKKCYHCVTVLLKQSYPNCTFGEEGAIVDEFVRMNIITKKQH
ncbi:uncharacterized protein LOC136088739 isoform X2 [Hydra vulgaris]|uniref:Uncharacterized protein LOC136088739 isoform X2 n=1 Tax=Hydra vulgaris TaxID=6087 RepID=A0ABM4D4Z9_HYDVU